MNQPPEMAPTFLQAPVNKLDTRRVRVLLMAVVGAGIGGLVWFAQYVPAITSELGEWIGRPAVAVDTPEGRRSHVIFLLLLYSAPLALGALVYLVNYLMPAVSRSRRAVERANTETLPGE